MSDAIPDEIKAAAIKALNASGHLSILRTGNPWEPIARALMAATREADEAATKRERERCARIADHWATDEQRQYGNGGPAAAILKGEA